MASFNRDYSNGKFKNRYTDQQFVQALRNSDFSLDTASVAEKVGCSKRRALTRLTQLKEEGEIASKKAGNTLIWEPNRGKPNLLNHLTMGLSKRWQEDLKNCQGMVLAIQRPHSQAILNGEKEIEFRRTRLKQSNHPDFGFIYETAPTKSLVGVFSIDRIEWRKVEQLYEVGTKRTPSSLESLQNYFQGNDRGTAIYIKETLPITPPIPLRNEDDGEQQFTPPQSFYYVDPVEFVSSISQLNRDSPPGESQQAGLPSSTS